METNYLLEITQDDGRQLELAHENGKIQKANVQGVKMKYSFYKLIKCLPYEKASGYATKYHAHQKLMEDIQWSLNLNMLPDIGTSKQDL